MQTTSELMVVSSLVPTQLGLHIFKHQINGSIPLIRMAGRSSSSLQVWTTSLIVLYLVLTQRCLPARSG